MKPTLRFIRLLLPLLLFLLAYRPAARAHAPNESTVTGRLQHDRLEVTLTMSPQMAAALIGLIEGDAPQRLSEENFASHQPQLEEKMSGLLDVFAGDALLYPTRSLVILNKLAEPTFLLFYPQPKEWPLRLQAKFLAQLPPGYSGVAEVYDANEILLGRRSLGREGPQAELTVYPASPTPTQTEATPALAVAPSTPTPASSAPRTHAPIPQTGASAPDAPKMGLAAWVVILVLAAILILGFSKVKPPAGR